MKSRKTFPLYRRKDTRFFRTSMSWSAMIVNRMKILNEIADGHVGSQHLKVHISTWDRYYLLQDRARLPDGLVMKPISGSTQPRVNVKHIHPFCLTGIKLSETLVLYQSCLFIPLRLYGASFVTSMTGNGHIELFEVTKCNFQPSRAR